MKSSSALRFLVLAALAPAAILAAAKDEAPAAAKMPVLKKDFSPIGDGKTPVVASYADIVEPVEKEVVSIASSLGTSRTRTTRARRWASARASLSPPTASS
jgi:S1-C subfamily serine protease